MRIYTRKRSPFYENWVLTEQFAFGKIVTGGGVAIFCHPYLLEREMEDERQVNLMESEGLDAQTTEETVA
ncbi:MAG: hypothetical protein J6R44_03580, partial [Clostridia bacterium]|nr:hypothetical protein [Clostridia bacterium]